MQAEQISNLNFGSMVARHRAYFMSGKTRSPEWRDEQLKALSTMITENGDEMRAALWTDLRRNWIEADHAQDARATFKLHHYVNVAFGCRCQRY